MGSALWVQDVAFINNPITNYHPLDGLLDQQIPLGFFADVAQLVEQLICNQQVVGSNPSIGSMVR